jgi:HD-GYP domain-containing protein (c-di-GMP phosphodiesterase class II)
MLSLAQTIELKDKYTRGHCDRVARYALMIADALSLSEETKKEITYGSWLHDC